MDIEVFFNSQTIPAWFVSITMILTGLMWLLVIKRKAKLQINLRGIAVTMILEGLIFGIVFQFFGLDIEFRGFTSRLMFLILAMSQFVPLAVAYNREVK